LNPRVLVLDESLTGLDLSTQAQIVELLLALQSAHSLGYLLISHDLSVVTRIATNVAVMSAGKIVEQGSTQDIVSDPGQPETKALVGAGERFRSALAQAHGASA
jgi:ABC-type oligopeptide transport system ATPase subunit